MKTSAQGKKMNPIDKTFAKQNNKEGDNVSDAPVESQVYAEYMSNIILQLPNASKLKLLTGTSSAQASFYFKDDVTGAVNASLYNNFLNQRIEGQGSQYGVEQVGLSQDSFTNAYVSVYTKIRYQLSPKDKAAQQKIDADVASTINKLIPIWNTWVDTFQPSNVHTLAVNNTNTALIQMTDTLNTVWLNPSYRKTLENDPSYPYLHLSDFKTIYNQIPLSVPVEMIDLMIEIYNLSGASGAITTSIAYATHTLLGIIANVLLPSTGPSGNAGLPLTGSNQAIPGLTFNPDYGKEIINQLSEFPIVSYTNTDAVSKLSTEVLAINTVTQKHIEIPILNFFYHTDEEGVRSSIFQEECSGSSYHVKAIVNNPVIKPQMMSNPIVFDIMTNQGWMLTGPAKEAIKNGYPPPVDVTGYVFNSQPNFNFGEGENFGYINSIVFSQFLELYITFVQCNTQEVKNYFAKHAKSKFSFLGDNIGFANEVADYTYEFSDEKENTITIVIKPEPPGYIPPDIQGITTSMCQLVAVEVIYPFA